MIKNLNIVLGEMKTYTIITFGLVLYAVGWVYLLLPYEITTGALTGLSAIIYYATGIPLQNTYFIINSLLLLAAVKILGLKFCIKTVYSVVMLTFFLWAFQELSRDASGHFPQLLGKGQEFMACIMGSALCGLGIGTVFSENGSTGGTDIVAAIVHKYRDISLGRVLIMCDVIIISSSYFVLEPHDIRRVLFGICTLVIQGNMVDYVTNSVNQSVQFFIISKKNSVISKRINHEIHRGATILNGRGSYSGDEINVLMVMARRNETQMIFDLILEIDPDAFITQNTVKGVFGNGFDSKKKK